MEALIQDQPNPGVTQEYPLLTTKKGEVPLWDHPFLKGTKVLPKKYYPYTNLESVVEHFTRGRLDEKDFTLLKVLGDAICANENQLRRYLLPIMSSSQTSLRLDRLRRNGFVERWKIRIHGEEDSVKPPAPFTLGMAGFKLLKHYYNSDFFMDANRWDSLGVGGIKRYVSMNELRCLMAEMNILKKWKWNPIIATNHQNNRPLGAGIIEFPQGQMNFLIDRVQGTQNYIGYFKERLFNWKNIYEHYGRIPVSEFPDNTSYIIIFASTLSIANHIHQELMLDTFPFNIWVCVEEDVLESGFNTSFYIPNKQDLKRIRLDF
ncbi:hypothetical protein LIS77_26020 (plasmid) [Cytobacillus firmus]|uniref:hypothetical protein n=1 Tax=Cytobacillus firmus TaxID=1399 RepID=UPI0001F45A55|nr:hypothetical protein [Cytobacillus firmus]EFV74553.1 hypothetical protein HMPREF1013_05195 [Bacillus sp. 2_A_57_CT2]USK41630.1 hypothetical protein LIS77_26020 [Cytobacillus firmus]